MSLEAIKQEYLIRFPSLKYHTARFWENNEGTFCQAFNEDTKEFYGNIFKLNLTTFQIERVK